jgi:hypothetical protein
MRAFARLCGKSQPFRYLARVIKQNVLRIPFDVLDQFPPLGHLMIPPVVAKGNQKFVAGKKHLSLGLMWSTAARPALIQQPIAVD